MNESDGIVCANRPDAEKSVVDQILSDAHKVLDENAKVRPSDFIVDGFGFEQLALRALTQAAKGTVLDGKIELISGHRFPDVLAKLNSGSYGIEVKSTTRNHWVTTGNSVIETTRVENIKRIYILFGKLCDPVSFKIRPYEECLSEVKVTHSPRYQIDMDLPTGQTIFDKIGMSYDQVREKENPAVPFINYYKSQLQPGESLWWAGASPDADCAPIKMTLWNNLSVRQREEYIVRAIAYFPELWSESQDKYSNFLLWLVRNYGVICGNVRDAFSAGGRVAYEFDGRQIVGLRHVVKSLLDRRSEFLEILKGMSLTEIEIYWKLRTNGYVDRLQIWLDKVSQYLSDDEYELVYRALTESSGVREIPRGRWGR